MYPQYPGIVRLCCTAIDTAKMNLRIAEIVAGKLIFIFECFGDFKICKISWILRSFKTLEIRIFYDVVEYLTRRSTNLSVDSVLRAKLPQ